MKLNVAVIADELAILHPNLHGEIGYDMLLSRAGYLLDDSLLLQENCLYVIDESLSVPIEKLSPHLRIMCCDPDLAPACIEHFDECIVFKKKVPAALVLNELIAVFTKYNNWERELLAHIAAHDSLKDILDRCAIVLYNPIQLASPSMSFVEYGGTLPNKIEGTLWEVAFEQGYGDISIIPATHRAYHDKRIYEDHDLVVVPTGKRFPGHTQTAVIPLLRGDKIDAMLTMLDDTQKFTIGQLSLFRALRTYVEYALIQEDEDPGRAQTYEKILIHMTEGKPVNTVSLRYYFKQRGLDLDDPYRVVVFEPGEEHNPSQSDLRRYISAVRTQTKCDFVYLFEDYIVAVFFERRLVDSEDGADRSGYEVFSVSNPELFLRQNDLFCAVSDPFVGFENISVAYQQAARALGSAHSGAANSMQRLVRFEEIRTDALFAALSNEADMRVYLHPRTDLFKKTLRPAEYARCTRAYLASGFNMKLAAQRLYMNKNSLQYRVDKLESLFGKRFKEMGEDELFSLWLSTLYVENLDE